MKYPKIKKTSIALLMSFSCSTLFADGIASISIYGASISAEPSVAYDVANLHVSSNTANASQSFQNGDNISLSLSEMADGLYHYKLTLVSEETTDSTTPPSVSSQSGQFRVINGSSSKYNNEIAAAEAETAERNTVSLEIVDGAPVN